MYNTDHFLCRNLQTEEIVQTVVEIYEFGSSMFEFLWNIPCMTVAGGHSQHLLQREESYIINNI